jgi:hypothetical protein
MEVHFLGQRDQQRGLTKLILDSLNFARVPKKELEIITFNLHLKSLI